MTDRILLAALKNTFHDCFRLALEHGLGVEIQSFAFPDVLQGDWRGLLDEYKSCELRRLQGPLTMHGPFMDMSPGSPDELIRAATLQRTEQALHIAEELGVSTIVFHTNFIASIHNVGYRYGWTERNIEFWTPLAERAARSDITIVLENMWEFDPDIITHVLRAINHPNLRACIDVGHAHLFSDVPFDTWLQTVEPFLTYVHMNNNPGDIDEHQALGDGALDYHALLPKLRALPHQPTFVLEMNSAADMAASFPWLHLPPAQPHDEGLMHLLRRRIAAILAL